MAHKMLVETHSRRDSEKPITKHGPSDADPNPYPNRALCSSPLSLSNYYALCARYWFSPKTVKKRNENMQAVRQFLAAGDRSPVIRIGVRALSTSDSASLKKNVASILDSLSLVPGATLVQNCGDSEIGKVVIQLAKERKLQTLSIIDDKSRNPDTIEELKALGADVVVPESYTKTWYMKRIAREMSPAAGLNFSDGYQATAVCKAVTSGGTFLTYGKQLPKYVAYEGSAHKPVEWSTFIEEKKLKVLNM